MAFIHFWSVLFPLTSTLMFLALFLMKVPHVGAGLWISVNVHAFTFIFILSPPMQKQMLSYVYREPWSGYLKLLRFILKYSVPLCCGLIIVFKVADTHDILDASQWFAAAVFMWITQFSVDTYHSGRFDFSRMLLVFFIFLVVIAAYCGWFPPLDELLVPSFPDHPTVLTTPATAAVPNPLPALIILVYQSSPPSSISTGAAPQTLLSPGHPTVPTTPATAAVPNPLSALIRLVYQSSPPSSISTGAAAQTSLSPLASGPTPQTLPPSSASTEAAPQISPPPSASDKLLIP
ncbi:hypothetical protein CRG98_010670 [Punica granatum]|uniref:Uncharacterized protein n=1 Tax=Punica granatum TaxID=22663 RepID=A0A2I0KK90_PUNGR|nr:hypothetical protein CRG98_010670 [Punica granatum]